MTMPSQGKISPSNAPNNNNTGIEPSVLQAMLDSSLITVDEELIEAPKCIEIINGEYPFPAGNLGDFSLIIGKAKQGKTFVISMALAAAESGMPFSEVIKVTLPAEQQKIILFDTEQSKYHVQKVLKRICKMAGKPVPDDIIVYSLRSNPPDHRVQMIEYVLQNINNIGLIVIDGIKDLVTSINDEEKCNVIVSKLMKWSDKLNIHIVTVLHMNKGDTNARGHLGTELTNKAQTVISVTKSTDDKNVAVVKAEYARDEEFEPWAFKIDEFGIPTIVKTWLMKSKTSTAKKEGFSFNSLPREKHIEIIKKILKSDPDRKLESFKDSLKNEVELVYGSEIPANRIKYLLTYYLDNGIMYKEGSQPQTKYRLVNELPFTNTD